MIRDPTLRFWIDYLESEGALCEAQTETAELILPLGLQRAFGLPEALTVTSEPDMAEDGGALLLAIGHPALDAAAASILKRGDVGRAFLTWPASSRMPREALLAHARALIAIDHGRIDAERDPVPVYYPLLRVGALITYTLDDRFQECEEVWTDACTGFDLPRRTVAAVRAHAVAGDREAEKTLVTSDLTRAVAAHAALDERATRRASALERHAQRGLRDEQQRAESYYDEVLAALEQRQAAAPLERRPMLQARADATRLERQRRVREIAAKFESSRTIVPYRLNLICVPALAMTAQVRRGERQYPLDLHWLLAAGCFATPSCPNCRACGPLVAGRTQLGCRNCLTKT